MGLNLFLSFFFLFSPTMTRGIVRNTAFSVYWNVPTQQCNKYGYNFEYVSKYGIIVNKNDTFKGNNITILYDPGLYPAIIDGQDRNGGIPQKGNLAIHLKTFQKDVQKSISKDFNGIGIIDFEHWRPIFRENWSKLNIYRQRSRDLEKYKHPTWSKSQIDKEAQKRFEKAAYSFMNETLALATKMRPKASWGYYAYPYCFNYTPKNLIMDCSQQTQFDSNRSYWMYRTGTALFPSVYLQQKTLSESKRSKLIQARVAEGARIAKKTTPALKVYPYTWFKYQDTGMFLSKVDMKNNLYIPMNNGASGIIIWGSSNDVSSSAKCAKLDKYVQDTIGPVVLKILTLGRLFN